MSIENRQPPPFYPSTFWVLVLLKRKAQNFFSYFLQEF